MIHPGGERAKNGVPEMAGDATPHIHLTNSGGQTGARRVGITVSRPFPKACQRRRGVEIR
jgi:hypothetical protein